MTVASVAGRSHVVRSCYNKHLVDRSSLTVKTVQVSSREVVGVCMMRTACSDWESPARKHKRKCLDCSGYAGQQCRHDVSIAWTVCKESSHCKTAYHHKEHHQMLLWKTARYALMYLLELEQKVQTLTNSSTKQSKENSLPSILA